LIGITCSREIGGAWGKYSPGHYLDYIFDEYSRAICGSGGAPVLIPVAQNRASLLTIISRINGLILSGGPDINPRFYREEPADGIGDIDDELDRMELEIAKIARKKKLPIFAICRGIQTLNVSLGGTLYQDIDSQVPDAIKHAPCAHKSVNTHTIRIEKQTLLHDIIQRRKIWVNGKHHQAIKDLAPNLKISAVANDGIVEAVEDPTHKFVIGVQWHPEGTWEKNTNSKRLFRAFVKAAE
jgi:putative glutamine amidotransferase